ncbi:hypothetical protein MYX07_00275 [Patescibacteria group bacterium AH-259-L07]|nr:hypothetical protein [Patescibacteria group bacterium AH-259-L07]
MTNKKIIEEILQNFENENHILFRDQNQARKLIEKSLWQQRQEFKKLVEGMRPYPFIPCPKCGGKLEFGSSKENRYGCYNKECPANKRNHYFYVDLYNKLEGAERLNQALTEILKVIEEL